MSEENVSLNRKKYTKFNIITSCVLQLATIIIALIIPNMMISRYGSEINGLVSWVTQMFNFFHLLEGGVSVAAAVALYRPFAEGDTEKVKGIYKAIARYYRRSGEILFVLSVISAAVFAFMFRTSGIEWYIIITVVMVTGITNSLNFLILGKFNVVCDADQHTFVLHLFTLTAKIAVFVLQFVFILLGLHIIIVEIPYLLMIVIRFTMTYFYIKKRYPYLLEAGEIDEIKFAQKGDALVIQIANLVKRNAPMIVLGIFGNLTLLSIYNTYASIFHASSSLLEMTSQSLTSNFGNLVVTEERKSVSKVYRRAEWIMTALLSVIMCCYMKLTVPFMRVYSRGFDTNYIYATMALLFTFAELLANLGVLPRMVAISSGYIKQSRNPAIIEAAASLAIGIGGYLLWGMDGLLIGCIIGSLARTGYHIYLVSRKILKEKLFESILIIIINAALSAGAVALASLVKIAPESYGGFKGYIMWAVLALSIFGISAIIIFGGNFAAYKVFKRVGRKKN